MPDKKIEKKINAFMNQIYGLESFEILLDCLPDVYFFVKDKNSKLITCNTNMLRLFSRKSQTEIYGKTGLDFFPAGIVNNFFEDDRYVIENNVSIIDRIELNIAENGSLSWFCTSKTPLRDKNSDVIGLMGVTRNVGAADPQLHPFMKMIPVLKYMQEHFREEIEVTDLADLAHLSVSQFHRSFKKLFRMPPLQFVLKLRIQEACKLLRNTDLNIGEITFRCGFNDQNYLARCFNKFIGVSPSKYRNRIIS